MPGDRTFGRWLSGLVAVAAIVRVGVFLDSRNWIVLRSPILDAGYYDATARGLLDGSWPAGQPYFMGPLYSYLMAGLYQIFGADVVVIRLAQMGAGLGIVALVGVLTRRLFGATAGVVAAALCALYGPLVFFEQVPLMATFTTLGALLVLDRALALRSGGGWGVAVVAGLAAGGLVAMRGTSLLYVIAVLLVIRPWRWRSVLLMLATGVLVVAPFTVHNWRSGSRALLTTNLGWNLFIGNGKGATGTFAYPNGWQAETDPTGRGFATRQAGRPLTPDESNRFWIDATLRDVGEDPMRLVSLSLEKIYYFLQAREIPQNENYAFFKENVWPIRLAVVEWWLALPLALLGVVAALTAPRASGRDRAALGMSLGWFAVPLLVCVVFFVTARYRLPAAPLLMVLGGAGVAACVERRGVEGTRMRWVATAVPFLAMMLLLLPWPYNRASALAREHEHMGLRLQNAGHARAAEEAYRRAIVIDPDHADAWNNLGTILVALDRPGEALVAFDRAAVNEPGNPVPLVNLGTVLGRLQRDAEAELAFRRALALDPANVEILVNLGTSLILQEKLEEGIQFYEAALRADPTHPTAREMLISAREILEAQSPGGSGP